MSVRIRSGFVAGVGRSMALWVVLGGILGVGSVFGQTVQVDPQLPDYEKVSGVSGNLVGIGSDTLNIMMDMWLKEFQKIYPTVTGSYRGEGSSTAPPALIEGTSQLAPMSRPMKPEEIDKFEKRFGYKPTAITVAIDCLAVYVHKDNPLQGLTMAQLDAIFSATRRRGHSEIRTWGDAGLKDPAWSQLPISLYGRNSVSGTYAFFKEHALSKGDFKDTVKEQPGSAGVIHGVANERAAIGYSGIGYRTADVRVVPLAKSPEGPFVEPTFENALKGEYPLARSLYIYVNKKPNEPLPLLVGEFLRFVLSKQGQQIVVKDGFGPLPAKIIQREREKLE